jgi:RNA polymerase sigma-70 factor (ECF subfamily)
MSADPLKLPSGWRIPLETLAASTDGSAPEAAEVDGLAIRVDVMPAADGASAPPAETAPRQPATVALFERAVREHSRRLLAIARTIVGNRASAEDVLQQALVNLYQHRDRYDWNEPGGLMRRSVVNEALRLLRQPRMTAVTDDQPEPPSPRQSRHVSPADPMIDRETIDRVRRAIDRLPEHFRTALVLCEYEGMAYTQIADLLGASVPQVKTWLHRGRRQLGEMLKDFMDQKPKERRPRNRPDEATDA